MRLMFASDIHGSAYYAKKLKKAFEEEKPDKLILLGDLLYHGPRNELPKEYEPKAVIEILNSMKKHILCVRGNCDSEVDQMVLDFPIMAEYAVVFADGKSMYLTHGHKLESLPAMHEDDFLIHGHTHIQAMEKQGKVMYINPGSISIPKNGNKHSYMIYEDGSFTIYGFDGERLMSCC